MKILFHIEEPAGESNEELISIRIGSQHAGYAITDRFGKKLRRLSYCLFRNFDEEVKSHLLQAKGPYRIMVGYDFPDAFLVEDDLPETGHDLSMQRLMGHDKTFATVLSDHIRDNKLKIIYAVPASVHQWVSEHFPGAECRHDYTITLATDEQGDYPSAIHADFRANDFSVLVWKHGKVVQAGSFPYLTPADVLYYLLRICQSFSLSQSTTHLLLSGLVDRQSSLFSELYQYFIPVEFTAAGWVNSTEQPGHFFANFQKLAACAS